MLVIDDAKLAPPRPANAPATRYIHSGWPGLASRTSIATVGTSRTSAESSVQFRPPNRAVATVYGMRSTAPTSVTTAETRNLSGAESP